MLEVEGQVAERRAEPRREARRGAPAQHQARGLRVARRQIFRGISATGAEGDGANALAGTVVKVKLLGSIVRLVVDLGGREISVDGFNDPSRRLPVIGESLRLVVPPEAIVVSRPEAALLPARAAEDDMVDNSSAKSKSQYLMLAL